MSGFRNKKNFKGGRGVRKPIPQQAYDDNHYVPPTKEQVSGQSETLQAKAFRDLANIGVIDVKADPNAEMSYGAFPYTVIGKTNPVLDANYPGYPNIAGNSITLIQNDTTTSKLMNTYDVGVVCKKINYNYLPIRASGVNLALAGEFIKSIEQAVSFGFSTMLTQLPFASATYKTDLPLPPQYYSPEGSTGMNRDLTKSAGYYAAMIHYQCVLQTLVQPIAKYIEVRSLEKELMRMSFRTEAPLITELFGLLKKSSFVSIINTIGTVVINEYFDVNWYKQNNTLQCVPSRKTKGMGDPLLTIVATHAVPRLTIDSTYDSDNLKAPSTAQLLNPETFGFYTSQELVNNPLKLEQLVENAIKLMNPAYILKFVRNYNRSTLPSGSITSISAYVESIKIYLGFIARYAASFSTSMSNIRTFLDKLDQSGMIYWKKGVSFFVDKIEQLDPHYNALLNDVFSATYSGADKIVFDNATKRWRAWAFWNKYVGIPEFDRMSGGSFLTFGLRSVQSTDSAGNAVDFNSSAGLIPVLFSIDANDTSGTLVTRKGYWSNLTTVAIDNSTLATDHYLSRLNVMSSDNISLKQPNIDITDVTDTAKKANIASAALMTIGNVFGYGRVKTSSTTYDRTLDPDYVAFIDLEIEDVSNQMIVYARNYAPFRVDTPNGDRTMGFKA